MHGYWYESIAIIYALDSAADTIAQTSDRVFELLTKLLIAPCIVQSNFFIASTFRIVFVGCAYSTVAPTFNIKRFRWTPRLEFAYLIESHKIIVFY